MITINGRPIIWREGYRASYQLIAGVTHVEEYRLTTVDVPGGRLEIWTVNL